MIKVIDLQTGNIGSVINALEKLNADFEVIDAPDQLIGASKIILPGVGSFDVAAKNLKTSGFDQAITNTVINKKIPILGICVGMQLLATYGYEGGKQSKGLDLIKGEVKKIDNQNGLVRVPHMGWNSLNSFEDLSIFANIEAQDCFYFVHSYAFSNQDEHASVATCEYGQNITAYIEKQHIRGTQFHPEKSQTSGLTFLQNFIRSC